MDDMEYRTVPKATMRTLLQRLGKPSLSIAAILLLFAAPMNCQLRAPTVVIPPTYFGLHIHNAATKTPWPNVSVPAWRLWDSHVSWNDLEPSKGQWRFETLDRYVALAEQHNAQILLTFGYTPKWASARPEEKSASQPGFAAEPRNLEDWQMFVRTVTQRYKGRIQAYELWNEPSLKQFWSGNTDQMLVLTREASQIIRSVDPRAIVVSPSATGSGGTKWLSEFLSKGGGQYVDVIGYHFYVTPNSPETMVPLIQMVQQIMADHGAAGKPLWNTESGWSGPKPFPSDDLGAAYLARAYILNWAAGVQRFYWYAWDNHGWVSLQTTEVDNQTLKPAGRAYNVVQKWLTGAMMKACSEDSNHTWTCQVSHDGNDQWILWNLDRTISFTVPPSWRAAEVFTLLDEVHPLQNSTIDIGEAPVLISLPAR
jgi:hypothetical protein